MTVLFSSIIKRLALAVLLFFVLFGGASYAITKPPNDAALFGAIDTGVGFLQRTQLSYGEFPLYRCNIGVKNCVFESTTTASAVVLYALNDIDHPLVEKLTQQAITFLQGEEEPGGVWRYWTSLSPLHDELAPDFDDIAVVSAVLDLYGAAHEENFVVFEEYRADNGAFYTWFKEHGDNEVTAEVNANALFYYSLNGMSDDAVCTYVNEQIISKEYDRCEWCLTDKYGKDIFPLYYNAARAFKHGAVCIGESREVIYAALQQKQRLDGSFGSDYNTAIAVSTLLSLGYNTVEVNKGVHFLLGRQKSNGSWSGTDVIWLIPGDIYISDAVVTALALEALNAFQQRGLARVE